MNTNNNVSRKLRKIEEEIDNYYKSNPLLKLSFATAAWSLLACAEDETVKAQVGGDSIQHAAIISDNLVNDLKAPMCWLYRTCKPGGQVPCAYDNKVYRASRDLFKLGWEYRWFVLAYTLAGCRQFGLESQGSTIEPTADFFTGIEYEAYDRLIQPHKSRESLPLVNFDNFPREAIEHSLKVKVNRFSYKLNPKIVSDTMTVLGPLFDRRFLLPSEWQFSRYSLGDFRRVFEAISAMAYIRSIARTMAENQGCINGYADSIYVPTCGELLRRVVRYSGVSDAKVQSIFDDLTYGNRGIKHPDPALQPLIKLNSKHYAIMPSLWLFLSPERNLTVLLNRFQDEQRIYSELINQKEALMRQCIITDLSNKNFEPVYGKVPKLPDIDLGDIDLAIINHSEKACLLLELKWFIEPAEAREILERAEEIEKGISQVLKFKQAFADNHKPLLEKLNIDSSYRLEGAVVSENWIGYVDIQSPKIPVIRADHLIAKLKTTGSLQSTMAWLTDRRYLPKEGTHFEVIRPTHTIGQWSLKWYGIKPLIKDAFFPL